jgi:nucleosome assembly protein 1-like 1
LKGKAGIPDFWVRAIKSNRLIWDMIKEKDQPIMEHLMNVETEQGENFEKKEMTLTLRMNFKEDNDFFKPSELTTTLEYESEDRVKVIKGTKIEWLEGKDPTKKKIKKKQKHKKTGETRTVVKTVDAQSFFNIFSDRAAPKKDEIDDEEENDLLDQIDETQ